MTGQAERIKEYNRGVRRAEPASRSRIAALNTFGLRYTRVDDFNVIVEDRYLLNLAMSYWREIDNEDGCHGYLISALAGQIAKHHPKKPATGRDSIAETITGPEQVRQTAIAESVTGPIIASEVSSAPRLPEVNQWP